MADTQWHPSGVASGNGRAALHAVSGEPSGRATDMSSVVIAVRARIYREGLVREISSRQHLSIVAVAADGAGAMVAMQRFQPDIVLADTTLDGAFDLVPLARALSPAIKVIAMAVSANENDRDLLKWAEAGAAGLVTCDNSLDELLACIDAVLRGELACSPRVSATLLRRVAELAAERAPSAASRVLTPRQTRILQMLRSGLSNKQIARELDIELATVKNHVHQVLQRLHVRHRQEAAAADPLSLQAAQVRMR
ncbi:response regulator transcription factor [Variovorax sp. J2P1-59]|uniref:LuxR C-terminal-related transcriptional regulator n=1 Tax=Variovorax flavidus TaxID=3053501 RepID=UPI0025767986|nr:response regulator transcription factor [Variovorax sp. J2P1-59]MDM0077280.1 response regulator transcription factor [Variovorax sp. J2P1-59]